MKITVNKEELLNLCKSVWPFIGKKPTHSYAVKKKDVHGYNHEVYIYIKAFRLRLASGRLFIAANNGYSCIEMAIDCDYNGEHLSFFVCSEKITKTLELISEQNVKISFGVEKEKNVLIIESGKHKYKSFCFNDNGENFLINCRPRIVKSMDFFSFKQILTNNLGLAPKNPSDVDRFKGVYLFLNEGGLLGAATDTYMGSLFKNEMLSFEENKSFCIENETCRLICGIKNEYDQEPVVIHFGDEEMSLNIGDRAIVTTRFIASQKLDTNVYYGNESSRIKVNTKDLLKSLNRLKAFVNEETKQIRLCFENGRLILCAEKQTSHLPFSEQDFSVLEKTVDDAAIEVLHCDYYGEKTFVMFNILKLIKVISLINADNLLFCDMNNGIGYWIIPDSDIIGTEQRCLLARMMTPEELEARNEKEKAMREPYQRPVCKMKS